MIIDIRMPPRPSGDTERDVKNLCDWTDYAIRRLLLILRNIDGENITEIPTEKIPMDYIKKELADES